MNKHNNKNELKPTCPYYSKKLASCPSSKSILTKDDLQHLLENCTCSAYNSCGFYKKIGERAA